MAEAGRPSVELYTLSDPRTGEVRYVGKAVCSKRRLKQHLADSKKRLYPVSLWLRKLAGEGLTPRLDVVRTVSADEWQEAEKALIATYRASIGRKLLNVAEGGDQPHCPRETRQENGRKNAAARDKRMWTLKRQMGDALRRGHVSAETKALMRSRMDVFGQFAEYL